MDYITPTLASVFIDIQNRDLAAEDKKIVLI
jgi:hypothetical protein